MRQEVKRELWNRFTDDGEWASVDEFVQWLRQQAAEFDGDPQVRMEFEHGWGDESDRFEFALVRPETDDEMAARIAENAARNARYEAERVERERAEFIRLRAKFGKTA